MDYIYTVKCSLPSTREELTYMCHLNVAVENVYTDDVFSLFKRVQHIARWRHQMETFSALLAFCAGNSPVTGELPAQRPVTRSLDVFFDLRLNK